MAQIKPLCAELQKVAIDELGEDPARIPEDLAAFKLWIQQQPHLKARTDDQFLIQFLRGSKYSMERAKERIDRFYTLKTKYPKMFRVCDIDDAKFLELYKLGCFTFLPTPINETGPRLVAMRFAYDAKYHNIEEIFPAVCAMYEVTLINDPFACINGMAYIADMGNTTMSQYLQLTPMYFRNFLNFMEKSIPLRIKVVYVINLSPLSQQIVNMILAFTSEKLKQRLVFCTVQELAQHIPLKYLPLDYGGTNCSLESTISGSLKTLQEYRDYFKENAEFGTDESLRSGEPLDFEGSYGVGGSFRKIAVD